MVNVDNEMEAKKFFSRTIRKDENKARREKKETSELLD